MFVEVFIRTPGENELVGIYNIDTLSTYIGELLSSNPNRQLIIRQAQEVEEASTSAHLFGGEF